MKIERIYNDDDGQSHFGEIDFQETEVRPGLHVTGTIAVTGVVFRHADPKDGHATQARHRAPRRQFGIILSGALEVECARGETKRYGPGSVVLLDDIEGEGHITSVVEGPCHFIEIHLADAASSTPAKT
jgi:hypothetical protein